VHLKSVEVQGFKTFAKKTELLFEPGITAVVGPNGSGKSNLVDAIRWVLGERSAHELRGARMEEIVYSGGARRAASGMAEVRLVIDNADGRLPVPFTELEVTRRGYRSGESDYWMNGARCRLRDIEELFASTGVTQEGYAVVAQDDVDHIIQTSAAERRALIEEAAGVRGLRSKRHEAIGKLKEADVSILRLGDLAAELGPRVEELRREAHVAQEQREMTAELDSLRGSLLQGEWRAARQAVKKGTARVEVMGASVAAAEQESQAYVVRYAAEKETLARAHDARLEGERRLGALRLAATHAASRVELLTERSSAARGGAAVAEAGLTEARQRLEPLTAEIEAARADIAAAAPAESGRPAGAAESDALAEATKRAQEAQALAETLRETHRDAVAQVNRLEERVASLSRLATEEDAPAASARRLVELLEIPAVRDAAAASGISPDTLQRWVREGRAEAGRLADASAAAASELGSANVEATSADARARAAGEAAAEAAAELDEVRRGQLERAAERRALQGRSEAVQARFQRAEATLASQRAEAARMEERLGQALQAVAALEDEAGAAQDEAAGARSALEGAPLEGEAVEVESLTRSLLEMEKGHLERQLDLGRHQEGLANASAQLEADAAVLATLTERLGGAREAIDDVEVDWEKTQREIVRLERRLAQLGPVNELAIDALERDGARLDAISGQLEDLRRAREGLERIAAELGAEIDRRFEAVFGAVAFNFQETFAALFVGGKATLKLDDPQAPEPGVEILAQPAGKRMRNIKLLSGGERALTALAFILALEKVTPSPFYVFDEVDAPLDDANIKRFTGLLASMATDNQFILITHNQATMTVAQALYGVTLEDSGVSRVVSVRLREGEVVSISGTG
jgi:chromosome segregation protein